MSPSFSDTSGKILVGGIDTNVGKVASALLAKHVRTLEILHSLQIDNAQLRQEIQRRSGEEEIQQRIAEAVAAAVAAPNGLIEELQTQDGKLKGRLKELEEELALSKKASTQLLDDARGEMESLRASKNELEKKCKDLEFEATSQARQTSLRGDLESKLREASTALALAEGRAADLARRLADRESTSCALQLRLKENEDRIRAMKAAETIFLATADEDKTRIADLESKSRGLREKLEAAEKDKRQLGLRMEQLSLELEKSREENADRSTKEQELLAREAELMTRATAAESKLSEERKRFQRLREDAKRKLEEEVRRYKGALMEYAREREQLIDRIAALSAEIESLRAHMNNNRSQFSKYVEAKTENSQLKEELDGLREMIVVAPRPPHRSHSIGGGSSSGTASSMMGGVINKHVSVERLRHSISVARGHHQPANSSKTKFSSSSSSNSGGSNSGAVFQGDTGRHQGQSIGGGVGRGILVRRQSSGHSSVSDGGGWAGAGQTPSNKSQVEQAGSSGVLAGESAARQRGIRPAQQVY